MVGIDPIEESRKEIKKQGSPQDSRPEQPRERKHAPDGVVFIGKKTTNEYVYAAITELARIPELKLKARGMSIITAVNVAEVLKNRHGYEHGEVKIGTEMVSDERRGELNISTIEIPVKRAKVV